MARLLSMARRRLHPTSKLEALPESNSIGARMAPAVPTKGSPGTLTCGHYSRLEKGALVNLPTALVCSVEPWVPVSGGCGTARTMSGWKYTVNTNDAGFTLILVRRLGTIPEFTRKVCTIHTLCLEVSY